MIWLGKCPSGNGPAAEQQSDMPEALSGSNSCQTAPVLSVRGLRKTFGSEAVLDGVSFNVWPGEVLGLLGPNGAGKTTTLRILVDILRPDSGSVSLLGSSSAEEVKERIGYLPEERGLYRRTKVLDFLVYLARLKGRSAAESVRRAQALLEEVEMAPYANKRADQLSKGMQQKVQFVQTFVHDPDLLLLDEPFSGLDPVSTRVVKDVMRRLKAEGKAIVLSTHLMNQAEDLCDRVVLINKGRIVLEGAVNEVRAQFSDNSILLECEGELPPTPGATVQALGNGRYRLVLQPQASVRDTLRQVLDGGTDLRRFELFSPPLEEIFVRVVQGDQE